MLFWNGYGTNVRGSTPSLAHVLVVVVTQHLLDEIVEVGVVAEHHVAAVVPDEPVRVVVARRQPAHMVGRLVDVPVVVTEFAEAVGRTEAGRAGAEDGNW